MSEQASARMLPRSGSAARPTATVRRRQPDARERGSRAARSGRLRLVADGGRLVPRASGAGQEPVRIAAAPPRPVRPHSVPPRATPPRQAPRTAAAPIRGERPPVRLTRRGKIVVTAAAVLAIGAVSMALAGVAQATGHDRAQAGPGSGVVKVVVRPGQSLWSVAAAYDPDADTRAVIREIQQMNSLNSDQVQPGQQLWVPRG